MAGARVRRGWLACGAAGGAAASVLLSPARCSRPHGVDGKRVPLPRNVAMTCGSDCGGLQGLRILEMQEGRAVVDFQAARGFFECYHRCIAGRKALKVARGQVVVESVLDVEGIGPGVSPWWVLANAQELQGRSAVWRVVLATATAEDAVDVYEAKVPGRVVAQPAGAPAALPGQQDGVRRSGFADFNRPSDGTEGFEAVFVPDSASVSLAVSKPAAVDARALAWRAHQRGTPTARVTLRTGQEDQRDRTLTDGVLTDDPVEAALVKAQRGAGLL